MEDKGIFKSSVVGGFDRKSVLDYIKEMTEKAEQKEKELTLELLESGKRCDELLDICKEYEGKMDALSEAVEQEREKSALIKEKAREINEKLGKQEEQINVQTDDVLLLKERVRQLQARNDMLELKSRKYDESTMQLGYLMLEAQKKADEVIKEAHVKAQQIIDNADDAVDTTAKGLDVVKNSYAVLKKDMTQAVAAILETMEEVEVVLEKSRLFSKSDDRIFPVKEAEEVEQEAVVQPESYIEPVENTVPEAYTEHEEYTEPEADLYYEQPIPKK